MNLTHGYFGKAQLWSAAQATLGYLLALFVLLGICGTLYKLIEPGGWMAQAFGRSATAGAVTLAALVVIACLSWFSSSALRTRAANASLYGFAAAGLYYLARFWMKGSL